MYENEIEILIELLTRFGSNGMPLDILTKKLDERLKSTSAGSREGNASKVIQYALDNWIIDKIIDEDTPHGGQVWFVKVLDGEATQFYNELSEVEKAVIKILRDCNDIGAIGKIREDDLLSNLREIGFDVQQVPYVSGKIADSYTRENGKIIRWWYLITQFELSDTYKEMIDELYEIEERKYRQMGL